MTIAAGESMIEPVHWGARLVLADDARYTEVDGQAIAVSPASAEVVQLTGEMASLSLRLDGRPLRDALAGELTRWDTADRRRVIEAVRRLKACGLLVDVPPGTQPGPADWMEEPTAAESVELKGSAYVIGGSAGVVRARVDLDRCGAEDDAGSGSEAPGTADAPRSVVTIGMQGTGANAVAILSTSTEGVEGGTVIERLFLPTDARVLPPVADDRTRAPGFPGPLDSFVALVDATCPRAWLAQPGVTDLLALIAERVEATWAEHPGATTGP